MTEETAILFENYLTDNLSAEEKVNFENVLFNDNQLLEQFNLYKETTNYLKHSFSEETAHFKNTLQKVAAENASIKKQGRVITMPVKWMAIAATVTVFIAVWFNMQNSVPVYSDFNNHEQAHFVERSNSNASSNEAQTSFNNREYQKAAAIFEKMDLKENVEMQLYYAVSLIEIASFEKSDAILKEISNGNSVYKQKAIWYLGLSQLKQKDYKNCKKTLLQLDKEADDYQKAQEIIKNID